MEGLNEREGFSSLEGGGRKTKEQKAQDERWGVEVKRIFLGVRSSKCRRFALGLGTRKRYLTVLISVGFVPITSCY